MQPDQPKTPSSFEVVPDSSPGPDTLRMQQARWSREYRYRLVDVFAEEPFSGNPLAVFTDATGMDETAMRRIARELNRSQTCFVFPAESPGQGPRIRVFTPHTELKGPRHPTIGTAFALEYEAQIARGAAQGRVVLQGSDGPISVSMFARVMTVRHPVPTIGQVVEDVDAAMAMLGLKTDERMFQAPVQIASSGVPFVVIPVRTRVALKAIRFRTDIWERTMQEWGSPKVLAFTLETDRAKSSAKMRVFAPDIGVFEDAATETACGPLAAYLAEHALISSQPAQVLVFEQGAELERPSYLHVAIERVGNQVEGVRVGGQCVSVGEGILTVAGSAR